MKLDKIAFWIVVCVIVLASIGGAFALNRHQIASQQKEVQKEQYEKEHPQVFTTVATHAIDYNAGNVYDIVIQNDTEKEILSRSRPCRDVRTEDGQHFCLQDA